MDQSIEEILRRLLMLGLPLIPLGCSNAPLGSPDAMTLSGEAGFGGASGTAGASEGGGGVGGGGGGAGSGAGGGFSMTFPTCSTARPFDMTVTVGRSVSNSAAWDMCVALSGDCNAICEDVAPQGSPPGHLITKCERVAIAPMTDAGIDADGDASDIADALTDLPASDGGGGVLAIHIVGIDGLCAGGRRPAGLVCLPVPARGNSAGRWLARAAALEAASVPAFRRLAEELAAHGAPAHLVAAARSAAGEEACHYALMARAARARGVEPRRPSVQRMTVRPLPQVARENAREGCVRETFGAMTAVFQARRVPDRALRAAMASIARDESRHARLAWEVDAWARTVLNSREMHLVDDARRTAGAELVAEMGRTRTSAAVARELGLPTDAAARRRAERAKQALWI